MAHWNQIVDASVVACLAVVITPMLVVEESLDQSPVALAATQVRPRVLYHFLLGIQLVLWRGVAPPQTNMEDPMKPH